MKIYIASSWKNQHGVEMLTALLREQGHEVVSFVEFESGYSALYYENFEKWVNSEGGALCFTHDTSGAMESDLVIYYAPSGKDAVAECGMAYAKGVPIIGLYAKGEDLGLMRRMINWYYNYRDLLLAVSEFSQHGKFGDK